MTWRQPNVGYFSNALDSVAGLQREATSCRASLPSQLQLRMMSLITLYHRTASSESWRGVPFDRSRIDLGRHEKDGWVDSREKMGEKYSDYLTGKLPGIDELHPKGQLRDPIWNSIASCQSVLGGHVFASPRTDGKYFITTEARDMLANPDSYTEPFRACLTAWMLEQRRLGQSIPNVDKDIIQQIQDTHRSERIQQRADRLLQFIASLSQDFERPLSCTFLRP